MENGMPYESSDVSTSNTLSPTNRPTPPMEIPIPTGHVARNWNWREISVQYASATDMRKGYSRLVGPRLFLAPLCVSPRSCLEAAASDGHSGARSRTCVTLRGDPRQLS